MKAGDYIYELPDLNDIASNRGELEELLANCVAAVAPTENDCSRLSNGWAADALLAALDALVTTDEQWAALRKCIAESRG